MISPRDSFGVYLEGAGPGVRAARFRSDVGENTFAAAREAWSGRILGPTIVRAVVQAALGEPDESNGSTLLYRLAQRPGYAYAFHFDPASGRQITAGYRRLGPPHASPARPGTPDETATYCARLAQLGATEPEILAWLGMPVERTGWWPIETWEYPDGLSINLRHGVVEDA